MKIARNSLYNLAATVVPVIASILTVPFYIDAIGGARFGALAVVWVLLGYFGQLDLGIGRSITVRISQIAGGAPGSPAETFWSGLAVSLAFAGLTAAVTYLAASYFFAGPFQIEQAIRAELIDAVWLVALCVPISSLVGTLTGALTGRENFRLLAIGGTIGSLLLQVLPLLAALVLSPDMTTLIASSALGRLVGLVIMARGVWRDILRGEPLRISQSVSGALASSGKWFMISSFVGPLMISADRFLIGAQLGAIAVAAYVIPFQIVSRLQSLPLALTQSLFPRFAAESGPQSVNRCQVYSVFVAQLFTPVAIAGICLAEPLLELWLGDALDRRSIPVAQILLAGVWCNAIAQVPYAFIQARGGQRFSALLHLAELPLYVGLLFGLGAGFGLAGIAAAFSIRCLIDGLVLVWRSGTADLRMTRGLAGPGLLVAAALAAGAAVDSWSEALASAFALGALALFVLALKVPLELRGQLARLPLARHAPWLSRYTEREEG